MGNKKTRPLKDQANPDPKKAEKEIAAEEEEEEAVEDSKNLKPNKRCRGKF